MANNKLAHITSQYIFNQLNRRAGLFSFLEERGFEVPAIKENALAASGVRLAERAEQLRHELPLLQSMDEI